MNGRKIQLERNVATWACRISAAVMYALAFVMLCVTIGYFMGVVRDWDGYPGARGPKLWSLFMEGGFVPVFFLLGRVFACVGGPGSPFRLSQSLRLAFAGVITGAYGIAGEFMPPYINELPITHYDVEPVSANYPGLWLVFVAFGLFLVCLAVVFRYSDGLFEDSDNIL